MGFVGKHKQAHGEGVVEDGPRALLSLPRPLKRERGEEPANQIAPLPKG